MISIIGSSPVIITEDGNEKTLFYNDGVSGGDVEEIYTNLSALNELKPLSITPKNSTDWKTVYDALKSTKELVPYCIFTSVDASKLITNNGITVAGKGIVVNVGNNTFDFLWLIGTAGIRTFRVTGITAEGTGTISHMRNYTNTTLS